VHVTVEVLPLKAGTAYEDRLIVRTDGGANTVQLKAVTSSTSGIGSIDASGNALLGNRPDPFGSATDIRVHLAKAGYLTVDIYSATGEKVATAYSGAAASGETTVRWNADDVPAGAYYYRVTSGDWSATGSMVVRK
jgi:hypothetical protein